VFPTILVYGTLKIRCLFPHRESIRRLSGTSFPVVCKTLDGVSSNVRESLSFSVEGTLVESESDRYRRRRERRCKGSDSRSATRPSYLSKVGRATPSEARVLALANIMANTTDPQRNILLSSPLEHDSRSDFIRSRGRAAAALRNNHEFMIVYQMCRVTIRLIAAHWNATD